MDEPRAQRTLVKSPPELWAEISDADALAGHLEAFGEIRITRLEPETTVAWEGDRARGTVELQPAGWGTKVTLTAQLAPASEAPAPEAIEAPAAEPEAVQAPEPEAPEAPAPDATAADPDPRPEPVADPASSRAPRRRGFLWRLFGRQRHESPSPASDGTEAPRDEPDVATPDPELPPVRAVGAEPPTAPAGPAPTVGPAGPTSVDPAPLEAGRAEAVLVGVLDDLGAARHRPFSRG
jgi:hypothetical protein